MSARSGETSNCFTTDRDAARLGDITLDDCPDEPADRYCDHHVQRGLLT
jgi:hypothetical protein